MVLQLFFIVFLSSLLLPPTLAQPGNNQKYQTIAEFCAGDVQALCGGFALIKPSKAMECLNTAYNCASNPDEVDQSSCDSVGSLSQPCLDALTDLNFDDIPDIPSPPVPSGPGPGGGGGGGGGGGNACFNDVARLCPPQSRGDFKLMTACLEEKYDDLSPDCQSMIQHRESNIEKRIPKHFLQSENKNFTKFIIAVSIAVLLVPLFLSAYAFKKSLHISNIMYDSIPSSRSNSPAPENQETLHLSFNNVSYSINDKQILHNISCSFTPSTLTAIMGPSGSGKTTLLSLLSGHMATGTFAGSRMLNHRSTTKEDYDGLMREQAYVEQDDSLLFPTLTVWETLAFAALLRLPATMTIEQKFGRAQSVMSEVQLSESADSPVGGVDLKGISGGQKRRLSIALELLRSPASLICDEPTSGLDSTTSLQLIQSLSSLAKLHNRTVVTTIHQPRAEIYNLFDNVVLLGKGGYIVYAGPAAEAPQYLDGIVDHVALDSYDNPADFVIDAMGLSDAGESASPAKEGRGKKLLNKLKQKTMQSSVYSMVNEEESDDENEEVVLTANGGFTIDDDDDDDVEEHRKPAAVKAKRAGAVDLARKFKNSRQYKQQQTEMLSSNKQGSLPPRGVQLSTLEQVVFLFARRFKRLNNNPTKTVKQWISMTAIGGVISYAFSYNASTLSKPYQTFMLLNCVSSVAMIMEYLILVPEYYSERGILKIERRRNVTSNLAYVITTALTEIPRAVLHASLMIFVSYSFHELNPDPTNVTFCVVCLMCGCVSWQSMICMVCCMFDEEKYAYDVLFMILGGGTLFGGMLVKLHDIPQLFKPIYYLSVGAVTQRALVVNDFLCCYLTATCGVQELNATGIASMDIFDGVAGGITTGATCPDELVFVGDGTDEGNLGRVALQVLGLDNVDPFVELCTIFFVTVVARVGAVVFLRMVMKSNENLSQEDYEGTSVAASGVGGGKGGNRGAAGSRNDEEQGGGVEMSEWTPQTVSL
jgi:ABC-type multidrug transport system ATPase subunit